MIYLDNASTQPVHVEALKSMIELYQKWGIELGNPSSAIYQISGNSSLMLAELRSQMYELLNISEHQLIVFTSSSSESNSMVFSASKLPMICDVFAHPSVKNFPNMKTLNLGYDTVLNKNLEYVLQQTPHLVSVSLVQHELGLLQDIPNIIKLVKKYDSKLHIDASQAKEIDIAALGADYVTISSHKQGGPIGIAALITKSLINPIVFGGSQESSMRAGTEALPLIAGFVSALEKNRKADYYRNHFALLKKRMREFIDSVHFLESRIVGNFVDYITCFYLNEIPASELVAYMDLHGIAISQGSACTSGSLDGMESIKYLQDLDPQNACRVSFGFQNTIEEIEIFAQHFNKFFSKRS